jgi:N-acetyl-alpha-D-glucosaminyl L-malate synthase BshA
MVCYPSIGGSGIVATSLGNELAKLGHQVHFISYEQPFRLNLNAPNVHFHKVNINKYNLFKYPDYTLPLAVAISAIHEKYKLDLVHVHYAVPHATAALLAEDMMKKVSIKPPKIITTLHGTDITLLAKDRHLFPIINYSIERSCCVTAVSNYLKKETRRVLKIKKAIEVIYNFYTPLPVTKTRGQIRRALNIKDGDFLAIHSSNLRAVKRIPDLLEIVSKMKPEPKFKLLILAGGDFSQYLPLVKKLGIQKKIIVKPAVLDIENYINAADLGIYTTNVESFGLSILECMAFGKPVLATKAGGVPEVMQNKKTGFLLPVGDVKGFAEKTKLLIQNPGLLQTLGKHAKQRALQNFSAQKIVNRYLKFYFKTLKA